MRRRLWVEGLGIFDGFPSESASMDSRSLLAGFSVRSGDLILCFYRSWYNYQPVELGSQGLWLFLLTRSREVLLHEKRRWQLPAFTTGYLPMSARQRLKLELVPVSYNG
jgi:hypothetical protein